MMREVVIVDYLRTPFSRSRPNAPEKDHLNDFRMDVLAGRLIKTMIERKGINPREIGDVLVGAAFQVMEQWLYGGRGIVALAELPETVPGQAIDRQCGSSMNTIHTGAMQIMTGYSDIVVSAGLEHMTHIPMAGNPYIDPPTAQLMEERYLKYDFETGFVMGLTAEKLLKRAAKKFGMTREDIDRYSLESHELAAKAQDEGFFKDELMPIELANGEIFDMDASVRRGSTMEKMASLMPSFDFDGKITPGNSSPLNAGATAMVLMSKEKAKEYGLEPMATIKSMGWAAVSPGIMGLGPVPASKKALKMASLEAKDIDFWEINEAFAVVALNAIKELGIDRNKVNVKGGAVAIGHPLGATGTRLVGTLARILNWEDGQIGLANACIGGGQGIATIIEKGG
ncbi:acetyl-CoA acetyltransferase [Candidatus Heimdallarchaeota archaeon B3_Heim]|nr:MAG: acetyl-CoA acetyltransferase [Candidatus Heimdallarchaeota archaeon B3_Heim]